MSTHPAQGLSLGLGVTWRDTWPAALRSPAPDQFVRPLHTGAGACPAVVPGRGRQ